MPSIVNLAFADPDQFQEHVRAANVEFIMTGRGKYRAELQQVALDRLVLQRGRQSLPHIACVTIPADQTLILFHSDVREPPSVTGKIEFHADDIVYAPERSLQYYRGRCDTGWASISPPPTDLAVAAQLLDGCDLPQIRNPCVRRPHPSQIARLRTLHRAVSDLAATAPDALDCPEVTTALQESLVRAVIACLSAGNSLSDKDISGRRDMTVMRRLEQTLETNQDRPLYLTELCAQVGVSARVFRAQCQLHLGMNPHRYLWLRRMKLARRALAMADPADITVANVANDHGFGELGRFAVAYRTLFGEPPSATLHRPPDARRPETGQRP